MIFSIICQKQKVLCKRYICYLNKILKKSYLYCFKRVCHKKMCILVCLGRLQSVRDRQFGLIFNQLKVRESMYRGHPKSNHKSYGHIADQQEERKRQTNHYKREKYWFKVDVIQNVCLGQNYGLSRTVA